MLIESGLGVHLGGRALLQDVGMALRAGELTAVVGPSGSGKTTLLRALGGDLAHQGRVNINGRDPRRSAPADLARQRAILAQDTQVAFAFCVAEVVAMGALAQPPVAQAVLTARIEHLLEQVGLSGMGARRMHNLSGGERQRVHLARVLLQAGWPIAPNRPSEVPFWLLLDEPVSSLDVAHQLAVMRLARAHADAGGGVLAVMHDLNLSAMFADRLVMMRAGRVLANGPPAHVFTSQMVRRVYGCDIPVCRAPERGPWMLVQAAGGAA